MLARLMTGQGAFETRLEVSGSDTSFGNYLELKVSYSKSRIVNRETVGAGQFWYDRRLFKGKLIGIGVDVHCCLNNNFMSVH